MRLKITNQLYVKSKSHINR